MSPTSEVSKPISGRRTVCDHCRRRRIRCDGEFPCNQCRNASLTCKREHVPKRRGPKRGSGRVINELRAQDGDVPKTKSNESGTASQSSGPPSPAYNSARKPRSKTVRGICSSELDLISCEGHVLIDQWISESAAASTSPTTGYPRWHPIMSDITQTYNDEPLSIWTSDQFRPTSPSYFSLIPTCLDLYMEHIYPIMPLVHMPTLRASIVRPLEMFEKNLIYALCAVTATHMSGKSILAPGPPSWETAGRFFLDECISVRQSYDFVEDKSLSAVISSYFLSTAFFELNQNRKSWYYLREALTLGQDLGVHDEASYIGLPPAEALCRRRTFWILYVTERSFAILRHKPLTLQKTPDFPSTLHEYENPEIHTGFMHLINSYHLLDASFVDSWNESADAPASTMTYTALQRQLDRPHPANMALTDIQKADILVTQQWLRLIVWQSSMRQGLLSSHAEDESMTFRYPLKIAHSLLDVISSLPTTSIEVHGMGIFEKIFEIGNTMLDVMQACGTSFSNENYGFVQDPFAIFVKTLSQTPNSQRQYANLLLAKAAEKPEIQRCTSALHPPLSGPVLPPMDFGVAGNGLELPLGNVNATGIGTGTGVGLVAPVPARLWRGSIVGEIVDGVYKGDEEFGGERVWTENSTWVSGSSDDGMDTATGAWLGKME